MTVDDTHLSLTAAFRQRTRSLHTIAERSGIVRDILSGQASRLGYALFLRNLLPVYRAIEAGLEDRRHAPAFRDLARPEIYRAQPIIADLTSLHGPGWSRLLPILPACELYTQRISDDDGSALLAHVYVRYLGDLNGGRVLKALLMRRLGLAPEALSFYEFPGIADLESFKVAYRAAIDRSAGHVADASSVVEEAAEAFRLNILLSEAVAQAALHGNDGAVAAETVRPQAGHA